jgi:hypothetical protein
MGLPREGAVRESGSETRGQYHRALYKVLFHFIENGMTDMFLFRFIIFTHCKQIMTIELWCALTRHSYFDSLDLSLKFKMADARGCGFAVAVTFMALLYSIR